MSKEILTQNFEKMFEKWPSPLVARKKIGEFTGGTFSPRYMANLDSLGKGPEGRIKIGRQTAYEIGSLIRWLKSRSKVA